MKKREDKHKDFEALKQAFEEANSVFVTGFEKMKVAEDFELRKIVRGAGGSYRVIKNNVAGKAADGKPISEVFDKLAGMTALAFTTGDPVSLAKALTDYAKTNPALTFKAGVVEGRVIDVKSIEDLAKMPSKEEILAKLLFLINAPAQRLVTTMNAVGRDLAVVLDQGCKENKFKES